MIETYVMMTKDFVTHPTFLKWFKIISLVNTIGGLIALGAYCLMVASITKKIHPASFWPKFFATLKPQFKHFPKMFFCSWVSLYFVWRDHKAFSQFAIQGVVAGKSRTQKGYKKGKRTNRNRRRR